MTLLKLTRFYGALASAIALVLLCILWAGSAMAQQSEASVLISQGVLAYDDKRYDEALGLFTDALKYNPDNIEALYYLGLVRLAKLQPALAIESLEKARAQAPGDPLVRYQLGVAYFALEQYDKAEPLLESVFKEHPKLENLGYYVGFMRYRRKDYEGAMKAFTTGTATDSKIQQLSKFYAGLAAGILGLSERAVAEVDEALRILPSSELTGPAERIRESIITARERERRLRAEIRLGTFYDDNVTVNPLPSTDPTAESLRPRKSHSPGELASLRVDYSFLRNGPWEASATYSFFQTLNNNLNFYNIQDNLAGLNLYYRGVTAGLPYQLGVQYSYDYLTLHNDPFLGRHTGTVFGTLVEDTLNLTTMVVRLQAKNFLQDSTTTPPENRDAKNWMVGPTHVFRFDNDRHLIRLGYQFDREDASGSDFAYTGHRGVTGGQYTLPWNETRLWYDYEIHFRFYDTPNATLPAAAPNTIKRKDTEQLHIFRIEQPLPNSLTLSVEYQGTFSHSNLAVFDFHRNVFSMLMSWTY